MTPPLSGQLYREVEHSVGRGRAVRPSDRQSVRGALRLAQERFSLTPALTWLYRSRGDMSLARLHQAGALLVASLLLVLTAATGVHSACNATCKRDGHSPHVESESREDAGDRKSTRLNSSHLG